MQGIEIVRCCGASARTHVDELARLRIEIFREYPYLYDGDLDYERRYLETYFACDDALVVMVFDEHGRAVGATTAIPLAAESPEIKRPFIDAKVDLASVLYLGESVLERPWRGRGLGARFFQERETHASRIPGITTATFCAVQRATDDPRAPANYRPLDSFWRRQGYTPSDDWHTTISWKEIGEAKESQKPMKFWRKRLRSDFDDRCLK